jgi:hypothetical protein
VEVREVMTGREVAGTVALCAAISAVIVGMVLGTPRDARQPAPAFTPTAFCPSGQHLVKARDGMPVCAAPAKHPAFDFSPRRSS